MARSTYFRREATVNDHTYGLPTAVVDSTALELSLCPAPFVAYTQLRSCPSLLPRTGEEQVAQR